MALTLNTDLNDCLIPIGNCLELDFTSDSAVDINGSTTSLVIPVADFDDVQNGSTITINGVTFTFSLLANDALINRVQIGASSADTIANLALMINQNTLLFDDLFAANVPALQLSGFGCDISIEVLMENLNTASGTLEYFEEAQPTQLKKEYSVYARFGLSAINAFTEARITPSLKLNPGKCSVVLLEIKKDIADILKKQVSTPLPQLEDSPTEYGLPRPEMISQIFMYYGESYGDPLNVFKSQFQQFNIFNGKIAEGWPYSMTDYCSSGGQRLLTIEGDDLNECRCGITYVYYHFATADNFLILNGTFYDKDGNILYNGSTGDIPKTAGQKGVAEIRIDLNAFTSFLGLAGINPDDIAYYDIRVSQPSVAVSLPIRVKLKDCNDPSIFVFKSSLGTWTGLSTKELGSESLQIERDYIETSKPCPIDTVNNGLEATKIESSRLLSVHLMQDDFYNYNKVEEFLKSDDVLYLSNGNWYRVQLETKEIETYSLDSKPSQVVQFRILGQ